MNYTEPYLIIPLLSYDSAENLNPPQRRTRGGTDRVRTLFMIALRFYIVSSQRYLSCFLCEITCQCTPLRQWLAASFSAKGVPTRIFQGLTCWGSLDSETFHPPLESGQTCNMLVETGRIEICCSYAAQSIE